ncbi:restriction endonuclease subunit S [Neobacillus mesonae]|uniref:restriction endonuclease subunit S n=1 Tax=Neobacillus mesonae TaxID=1193713 RepID=UPI0020409F26|nr:restriction endonuclease subunit S [Neobacillus mesonae]MCM3567567.1 restriction endonuclease subunit S [Neobacillus mesonae]
MKSIKFIQLGKVIERNKEQVTIEDNQTYKQVTVRLWGKGVQLRDEVKGHEIKSAKRFIVKPNQFIISKIDARNGASGLIPNELDGAVTTGDFLSFNFNEDLIIPEYLFWLSKTTWFIEQCVKASSGTTNRVRLNEKKFLEIEIPLPNIEQQKVVIQKINNVVGLINQAETELNEQNELVAELQKAILCQGIQGKLLEQNSSDEPVSELLERLQKEKGGQIQDEIPISEVRFELPKGWEWVRLGDISSYIQRGKSPKYSEIQEIPVIAQKCIQWSGFEIHKAKFIDPDTLKGYSDERFLKSNDLLWNSTGLGTLGRIIVYKEEYNPFKIAVADSHVTVIRPFSNIVDSQFLFYWLSSPFVQSEIESVSTGSTKQIELSTSTVKEYPIPLAPLEEQKRIVKKIDSLMEYLNKLKEEIHLAKDEMQNFTKKVFQEAFGQL